MFLIVSAHQISCFPTNTSPPFHRIPKHFLYFFAMMFILSPNNPEIFLPNHFFGMNSPSQHFFPSNPMILSSQEAETGTGEAGRGT
jgi:hypothetical protein